MRALARETRAVLVACAALLCLPSAVAAQQPPAAGPQRPVEEAAVPTTHESRLSGRTEGVHPLLQKMRPVTAAMIHQPEPGSWLSFRRNSQAWGCSPLKQIDRECV